MRLEFQFARSENTHTLMRRIGYAPNRHFSPAEPSYHRRLSGVPYPQFHIYVNADEVNRLILNLHLDAKQPSYAGTSAHAGEYDGPTVEREADRIKAWVEHVRLKSESEK